MNFGFPKTPRHISETDGPYSKALLSAYLDMVSNHTAGAMKMPPDIEASWSKKGRPTALTVRAAFGSTINDAIVHDPADTAPVAAAKMAAASRMVRLALRRRRPAGELGLAEVIPADTFGKLICPLLLRRVITYRRFGLDRLDAAFNEWRMTRRPKFEVEYRPRGRSDLLLPTRAGDTMEDFHVRVMTYPDGPEIDAITLGVEDGISYKYAAGSKVRHALIIDRLWPATTCSAIAGRRLEDVIMHDVFVDCGHIVMEASPLGRKTRLVLSPSYDTVRGY